MTQVTDNDTQEILEVYEAIDNIAPEKPIVEKLNDGIIKIAYNGKEKIKGYTVFVVDENKAATMQNAILVQLVLYGGATDIDAQKVQKDNLRRFKKGDEPTEVQ